jgi:hypothetical protein
MPLKPLSGFIAMLETAAVLPSEMEEAGLAVILKSCEGLVPVASTLYWKNGQLMPATRPRMKRTSKAVLTMVNS